ncbi:MAG: hypothetical protein ABIJ85_04830 [bacterium]
MTNEFLKNRGKRIEITGKGRVSVKFEGVTEILKEDAAPRVKDKKEEIPTDDIEALQSLVNQAFPEEGLGMGQAEYFVPKEKGSQEEIISACARLAKKGWSSERVAVHIVNDNIRIRASLNLVSINKDNVASDINKLVDYLSQFYPGNQTRERRQKVSY